MARHAGWGVSDEVLDRWVDSYGRDAVRAWLVDAQKRAAWCAQAWGLKVEGFLGGGSQSCVLACRRADGSRVVLKLLAPWIGAAVSSEAVALSTWRGCGVVELLDRTRDDRALLLRAVLPGGAFSPSGNDRDDCERVAQTLRALAAAPADAPLPALGAA